MAADQVGPSLAPPTDPGELAVPGRLSTWPTVIGVLAIVFGSLATLGGLCGVLGPLVMPGLLQGTGSGAEQMAAAGKWQVWSIVMNVISMALSILLLVAGIKLSSRRASAATLCTLWAKLKILAVIGFCVLFFFIQRDQLAVTLKGSAGSPGVGEQVVTIAAFGSTVVYLLWGVALPVFMLIWFSRQRIREEVATWQPIDEPWQVA